MGPNLTFSHSKNF